MPFPDDDMKPLPPVPESGDPVHIAAFVDERVAHANRVIINHMDRRFTELRMQMLSAFPNERPDVNRQAVEAMIDRERQRAQFWAGLRETLMRRGVLVVLGVVAMGLLIAFKDFIERGG